MEKWLAKAVDEVDACLFTGDSLADDGTRKEFKEILERWKCRTEEWDDIMKDE